MSPRAKVWVIEYALFQLGQNYLSQFSVHNDYFSCMIIISHVTNETLALVKHCLKHHRTMFSLPPFQVYNLFPIVLLYSLFNLFSLANVRLMFLCTCTAFCSNVQRSFRTYILFNQFSCIFLSNRYCMHVYFALLLQLVVLAYLYNDNPSIYNELLPICVNI